MGIFFVGYVPCCGVRVCLWRHGVVGIGLKKAVFLGMEGRLLYVRWVVPVCSQGRGECVVACYLRPKSAGMSPQARVSHCMMGTRKGCVRSQFSAREMTS